MYNALFNTIINAEHILVKMKKKIQQFCFTILYVQYFDRLYRYSVYRGEPLFIMYQKYKMQLTLTVKTGKKGS